MSQYKRGYRCRIYPNNNQKRFLAQSFGCVRFVYNHFLRESIDSYKNGEEYGVSGMDFGKRLVPLKMEYPWLYNVSSQITKEALRDLGTAYTNFFRNIKKGRSPGFPRFKKKSSRNSFRLPRNYFDIRGGKLCMGRLNSTIRMKLDRDLPSEPSSCTISQDPCGRYYASFVCERESIETTGIGSVGVDVGLTDFITLSTGEKIESPKYLIKSERKLRRLQRGLSRKQKDSSNWNKVRIKVARQYAKIRNQRNDFLHKLTRRMVNENQVIVIETLNVKGMVRNRHLSKAISDASWSKFFEYLKYKAEESLGNCKVIQIPMFYASTQICSNCDEKSEVRLKLHIRKWECPNCGSIHDRDVNAAKNILKYASTNEITYTVEYTFAG